MTLRLGLTKLGGDFSKEDVAGVWEKGHRIPGAHPDVYRTDDCGAWMARADHGNVDAAFGWQIDHIFPRVLGGGDEVDNLRPLHWKNNLKKLDTYPWDPAKDKADVPKPALAVLLEAIGVLGLLPTFRSDLIRSVDGFVEYIKKLAPGANSTQRVARDYSVKLALDEASRGHLDPTIRLLRNAIESAR